MHVRKANENDLSRIAEIYVYNNRVNYFPIFKDANFSFGELQVTSLIDYFMEDEIMKQLYVFDDGLIKGFMQVRNREVQKLYVDTFFQSNGIGKHLIEYAIHEMHVNVLWALEKNTRAINFYKRNGFHLTKVKKFEEGTTEFLVEMKK